MSKKIILAAVFALLIQVAGAQHSMVFTQRDNLFHEGKELFDQRKWAASYRNFEEFLKNTETTNAGMIQEAAFYMASGAYELRQKNALDLLLQYLENHPYTPYLDRIQLMLGMLEYESRNYDKALAYFRQIDETHLVERDRTDYLFSRGYANLEINDIPKALDIFKTLKSMNSAYQPAARYYTGYSQYRLGNYDEALTDLLAVEKNPEFEDIAPYYIAQIYYFKRNFGEMEKRAEMLIRKYPDNINNAEIYRMTGEKAYADGNYTKAIDNLKKYENLFPQVLRNDMYYLGISYLKTGKPADAVKYLSQVTIEPDEMTESAYLQLGNAYVAMGNKENARLAFEAATQTNFNTKVREEALFNYALTTYETNTAFGESVKAFELFIREFPNSANIDKAYDYLSTVYLTSKNYSAAYQSVSNIKTLTPKLRETKQYLEYQLGTESFAESNYQRAIEFFTKAIQSAPTGRYLADSYFWRGESHYRSRDYVRSVSDLNSFFSQPNVMSNPNYTQAHYALGYAWFSQKKYNESLSSFLKYVNEEKNSSTPTYADALNRIGDAYFSNRNFTKASEYYEKVMNTTYNGDYALFQSAYMTGLNKNYNQKISKLEDLLNKYPNSEYGDDALYEIARAYLMLENNAKTIETYNRLIAGYPNSQLAPKALLETGMVYFNQHEFDRAIPAFKKVVAEYPASEEADTALESLETIYINTNKVGDYLDYTKSIGKNIESGSMARADSILFVAAEKQYMAGNHAEAAAGLHSYLSRYCPGGKFCTIAQYYLADSYYTLGDKLKALDEYIKILDSRGNPYTEEAALRAAGIAFDNKDYTASMAYFKRLEQVAQTTENKNIARLGVLRTSFFLNNTDETIQIAGEIIADSKSTAQMRTEALLNRAKALSRQNKFNEALKDLKEIKIDTRTSLGAEAKFALSETYFKLNKLNDSEKEVLDFAKKSTPHQYWLARSFIVLSDIYTQKGDDFQAKQYLQSLQKNYTAKDDVQEMIAVRMAGIEKRAKERVIK